MMSKKILNNLYQAVVKAKNDIRDIEGSNFLRGNLGTEAHFLWRTMYNFEYTLPAGYIQSPEVKPLGKGEKTKSYDFGVYHNSVPVIIAEFKMSTTLTSHVKSEYPKLIKVMNHLTKNDINRPFIGLIFYLEKKEKTVLDGLLAKKYCPTLYAKNHSFSDNYFEFLVHEETDKAIVYPKNLFS